jgi:hypothetical protein
VIRLSGNSLWDQVAGRRYLFYRSAASQRARFFPICFVCEWSLVPRLSRDRVFYACNEHIKWITLHVEFYMQVAHGEPLRGWIGRATSTPPAAHVGSDRADFRATRCSERDVRGRTGTGATRGQQLLCDTALQHRWAPTYRCQPTCLGCLEYVQNYRTGLRSRRKQPAWFSAQETIVSFYYSFYFWKTN